MSDAGAAWKETGERVAALGASLRRTYDERARTPDGGDTADLGQAARRFAAAVQDAADSLGATAQDPAVTEDARRVGTSLAEALSVTFAEVSAGLHRMAMDTDEGASPHTGSEPPRRDDEEDPGLEPWGTP